MAAVVALAVVVLVVAAAWAAYESSADEPIAQDLSLDSDLTSATSDTVAVASSDVETTSPMVEIPDIAGETLAEARIILSVLGLTVETVEEIGRETSKVGDERIVVSQQPAPGTLADAGTTVILTMPRSAKSSAPEPAAGYVVCIDPGHQAKSDSKREPIGPGASETKPRVTGGTQGVVTGVPEYEVVLQIANNLKTRARESRSQRS